MKLPKAKEGAPLSTDALPNLLEMPIQDLRNLLVDSAVGKMPAHPPVQASVMAKQVDIDMIDLSENNCQDYMYKNGTTTKKSKQAPEALLSNHQIPTRELKYHSTPAQSLVHCWRILQLVATSALQKLEANLEHQRHLILRAAAFCHCTMLLAKHLRISW